MRQAHVVLVVQLCPISVQIVNNRYVNSDVRISLTLRYNEDLELEDAVHTAILTLKVGYHCMYILLCAGVVRASD